MTILTDIGGTYARFALAKDGALDKIQKYTAADFPSLAETLQQYCDDHALKAGGALRIATAGYDDNGVIKFVNKNKWEISLAGLKQKGWDVECVLNDFEAATWALMDLKNEHIIVLKKGKSGGQTKCLFGPGTGLGLGYLHTGARPYVQKTHGGHMPATALTDEQREIIQGVQALKTDGTVPVFEDFVSGSGLYDIYVSACKLGGITPRADTPKDMMEILDDPETRTAIRLFHEFMGLFAANVVITGHAYGGLYMNGGVLRRFHEHDIFDFKTFEKFFCLETVASVKQALQNTPVIYVTDPFPALRGLIHA